MQLITTLLQIIILGVLIFIIIRQRKSIKLDKECEKAMKELKKRLGMNDGKTE